MKSSRRAPYSCVIIDDDSMVVSILTHYVSLIDKIELKGSYTDPIDATAAFLNFKKIDFLFIDIEMGISGIDVARMLRDKVAYVIFITGHSAYALDAFSEGDRFLVKPVNFEKFMETVNSIISRDRSKNLLGKQSKI
ncbi:LytR/AlgR family response regulator transcription factor [Pedobacter fastidiosus]|uniref:Response regulator n=1 Tax=Pedobacter fastidiosus TaxID=2765361 RepID=A0ABR7KS08_9SPHI|nr:response regulator [Pedobacter fastidiosus]MBC6110877.1 response regulator [Pedobacter fastidiosus]